MKQVPLHQQNNPKCTGLASFLQHNRGENTPSVVIHRDGELATDYGRLRRGDPKQLDRYQAWCLINGIDKREDLKQRIKEWRETMEVWNLDD